MDGLIVVKRRLSFWDGANFRYEATNTGHLLFSIAGDESKTKKIMPSSFAADRYDI